MRKRAVLLAIVALFVIVGPVRAAKAPVTECWLTPDPLTLYVVNIPTNDEFSITSGPYPTGTTLRTADGTFTYLLAGSPPITVYVWRRGGGTNLLKAGKQLNDYHVIAICSI